MLGAVKHKFLVMPIVYNAVWPENVKKRFSHTYADDCVYTGAQLWVAMRVSRLR